MNNYTQDSVTQLVRKNEQDYLVGNTTISKYVTFSLSENVNKIDAYINSKHISGETDSLGREKPFFNICTASVNIWYRATDIDRKDIFVKPAKEVDIFPAYLATIHLQDWMKREKFGVFLNEWGRTLARYGSAVVKFIEAEGKLHSMVIPWNRLIVDAIDFDNDVVIEVLELTPAQLKQRKGYDQDIVDKLVTTVAARQTLEKQNKDTKSGFIKVYEVHGEMPLSYITGLEQDEYTYTQQMHVVSYVESSEAGKYDDFCLYKGREEKNPYMITHLIKEDGRTQSIGAVEHLFDSQWMMNHTAKSIKDQLDLASKLIFQTSDGNYVGQNALSSIETGDILVHKANEPLTQLANSSHDIGSLQAFGGQWKALSNEINGISEAMLGQNPTSGTAWRQTQALLAESHSLFEIMTENKGLHLEDMLRTYVIPFIKKGMDTKEEITATLDTYGIDKIEKRFVRNTAIKNAKNKIRESVQADGTIPNIDLQQEMATVQQGLNDSGAMRFFKPSELDDKTWKDILGTLEWDLDIIVTPESKNAQNDMETLTSMFQTVAANPAVLQNPLLKTLFNKILTTTGTLSPIEIQEKSNQPSPLPATPTVGAVGADVGKVVA